MLRELDPLQTIAVFNAEVNVAKVCENATVRAKHSFAKHSIEKEWRECDDEIAISGGSDVVN